MLELSSPDGAFEQIEALSARARLLRPGGEELEADLYLGYGLSAPLRRHATPLPPEPCPLPCAAVAIRDVSQGQSLGHVSIGHWERSWSDAEYAAAVESVRTAIARGDVYQVNLVQHLSADFDGDPAALAGATRRRSGPARSPVNGWAIVSASPELFLAPARPARVDLPDQGHAPARRARRGREGLGRARDDRRSGAERPLPRLRARLGAVARADGRARARRRHPPRLDGRRNAARRTSAWRSCSRRRSREAPSRERRRSPPST